MKVFLLHRDRDFDVTPELRDEIFRAMVSGNPFAIVNAKRELARGRSFGAQNAAPRGDDALTQDLELNTLWNAMAAGDEFMFETAKRAVLSSLTDPGAIAYRQQVVADCLNQPTIAWQLYDLAIEALAMERQVGGLWTGAGPSYILHRSVRLLRLYLDLLKRLRGIADEQADKFHSEGFARFFAMLREELGADYLTTVERHLSELEFKRGVVESAELAKGDKGQQYVVHPPPPEQSWKDRLPFIGSPKAEEYSFELHPRDEAGARQLEEIRARGINHVADAVAQSAEHVQSFFTMLRLELAFYLGSVNLHNRLADKGKPTCFPEPRPEDSHTLYARDLFDVCLTFHHERDVIGNDLQADGKSLVMITGANQGGKSTFLRSVGLAQAMMQCGMFVGAEAFRASVCTGIFTHYKREEDATMESGKLDEELARMSLIADRIRPGAILLCNESFASTNEREGSEIARQIVHAMLDRGITVFFVTHMFDLADSLHAEQLQRALFLRAEREVDGRRTFKLAEHEPLPTSHGQDSYERIFGAAERARIG
jgi:hypothetical protein